MERAEDIQYTKEYFEENNIIDLSFFGTRDYRNKQTILSDKVYGDIDTDEDIIANGYQTNYEASGIIGVLKNIYVNGVEKTIGTTTEKNPLGIYADFYYSPGGSIIEANDNYIAGTRIRVIYTPLVKGRQIVYNNSEINRINNQTGRNGTIARYETRNDILSSDELNQVAQTYIQYKGTPEIILTIKTKENMIYLI